MSSNKYSRYDKGRFVKPVSRRKRAQERREYTEKLEQARTNITKWIDNLPSVSEMTQVPLDMQNEDHHNASKSSKEDSDELSVKTSADNSAGISKLNKAFCTNKDLTYTASPVKCDISEANRLPRRLRERHPSAPTKILREVSEQNHAGPVNKSEIQRNLNKQPNSLTTGWEVKSDALDLNASVIATAEKTIATDYETSKQLKEIQSGRQSISRAEMDIKFKCPPPIDQVEFENLSEEEKMGTLLSTMNNLCVKMEELDMQNNHHTDGLQVKTNAAQSHADENSIKISKMTKENGLLRGIVHRLFLQIRELNEKVTFLTAKSMENTLIMSGIEGDVSKEKPRDTVIKFLKEKVQAEIEDDEILFTHRIGKFDKSHKQPRPLLVRCQPTTREKIMAKASNLKDQKNTFGDAYYINKQLPEKIVEQRREARQTARELAEREKNMATRDKSKIELKNNTVYINGKQPQKELLPPAPLDMFPDAFEADKIGKIKLSGSDVTTEMNSDFQAYAIRTGQFLEVQRAYCKVRGLHPTATHVIAAYNLKNKQGFQDDDEHAAGNKILKLLQDEGHNNVAVFVTRAYSGVKLGPKRFTIINECALQAVSRIGK